MCHELLSHHKTGQGDNGNGNFFSFTNFDHARFEEYSFSNLSAVATKTLGLQHFPTSFHPVHKVRIPAFQASVMWPSKPYSGKAQRPGAKCRLAPIPPSLSDNLLHRFNPVFLPVSEGGALVTVSSSTLATTGTTCPCLRGLGNLLPAKALILSLPAHSDLFDESCCVLCLNNRLQRAELRTELSNAEAEEACRLVNAAAW